jgi:hypothetical protein
MFKIRIVISLLIVSLYSYGQPKEYIRNDSLVIKIRRNFYLDDSKEIQIRKVKTKVNFDFKDQYPFYTLNSKQFGRNNKLALEFTKLPQSGYLYFFTKYKDGTFDNINVIECVDSLKLKTIHFNITSNSIEYMNFWFTKEKYDNFDVELGKLHYSIGNFIHRTINYLDKSLNYPNNKWNFLEKNIGIEFDTSTINKVITPIIIKFK